MLKGLIICCLAALGAQDNLTEQKILNGADARIQEHRTGEITLNITDPAGQPLPEGTAVHIEQTRHAFLFGCNIFTLHASWDPEINAEYADRFANLFNYATLPFYWWGYEPAKGYTQYKRNNMLTLWCNNNGVTPKGHPLAWNWREPKWLPDDSDKIMELQLRRIEDIARRFKGRIDMWDVVNEATNVFDEGRLKRAPKLSAAIKKMGVGEFLRAAFQRARKANPDATLLINDWRLDKAYAEDVIKNLVDENGEPLYDVIGLQSHQHGGAMPIKDVWQKCELFSQFGKPLHWTENTFVSGELGWDLPKKRENFDWISTVKGEERQAEEAVRFYTVLFSHPAVEAITWWDFCDRYTWQAAPSGLLRKDLSPKPAYNQLHFLIKRKWWTETDAKVGQDGTITFHGFYGDYYISTEDEQTAAEFELRKDQPEPLHVQLHIAD